MRSGDLPRETRLTGLILAERTLLFAPSENSQAQEFKIRLEAPERQDNHCYSCNWELAGSGYHNVRCSAGADAFQAIDLAFKMIGVTIRFIAQEKGYRFTWLEQGFPGSTWPAPDQ